MKFNKAKLFASNTIIQGVMLLLLLLSSVIAQLTKTHQIGKIHDSYKDSGSLLFKDKDDKMRWDDPGITGSATDEDLIKARGIWLGAKNFTDINGNLKPYAVSLCGLFSEDEGIPVSVEKRIRRGKPVITIDDGSGAKTEAGDVGSVIYPDLASDESIITHWKTPLGVDVVLTTYAYGQPGENEYIIQDYILKNTGDMDSDSLQESNLALEDFWFGITYMPRIGKSTKDDLYGYIGRNYANGSDPFRLFYHWDADNSQTLGFDQSQGAVNTEPDDTGDPDLVDGSIRFHPYIGFGILHADSQAHAMGEVVADAPDQPRTVQIFAGDHTRHAAPNSDQTLYEEISQGTIIDDAVPAGITEWPTGTSKTRTMIGIGPYNVFEIGHEIRIVLVAGIGGVSTKLTEELGQNEFNGLVTKDKRLQILKTGLDSLKKNILFAKNAFESDYNLPDPPPPPDYLNVISRGGNVYLEWSDSPRLTPDFDTNVNDFAGYKVYKAVGSANRSYSLIETITRQELESNEKSTTYRDYDVSRGVVYYYRIISYDDGSQNWINPGRSLESTNLAGNTAFGVPAFSQEITNANQLNKIRVIPNPYNIFGVYNFPGEALQRNKILFSNLPAKCTIRIFTVCGDLVQKLEHADGSGDESWDLINISNQLIMSGIYIAHIDSDIGSQVVKFVVVR